MWLRIGFAALMLQLAACQSVPSQADDNNVEKNPKAAEYNVQAGLGYLQQGEYERALSKFEKALQQQANHLEASLGQAAALQSLGRSLQAESVYESIMAAAPKRHEPASAYAGLLCEQHRFQQAEAVILQALKKAAFSSGEQAYLRLARCAVRGQRNDLAEIYLARAESIAKKSSQNDGLLSEIDLQWAWLAYQQQRYDVAQQRLDEFERSSPLRADAVRLGYQIAQAENNLERMATYEQILRQNYAQLWTQIKNAQ